MATFTGGRQRIFGGELEIFLKANVGDGKISKGRMGGGCQFF